MNKQQALKDFWNRFGVLAFEENSVPDDDVINALIKSGLADSKYPYITYQVVTDDISGSGAAMATASIWDKSNSWERSDLLSNQISRYIQRMNTISLDNGRMYIIKNSPFSQHMREEGDSTIRRIVLNIGVQFFTEY